MPFEFWQQNATCSTSLSPNYLVGVLLGATTGESGSTGGLTLGVLKAPISNESYTLWLGGQFCDLLTLWFGTSGHVQDSCAEWFGGQMLDITPTCEEPVPGSGTLTQVNEVTALWLGGKSSDWFCWCSGGHKGDKETLCGLGSWNQSSDVVRLCIYGDGLAQYGQPPDCAVVCPAGQLYVNCWLWFAGQLSEFVALCEVVHVIDTSHLWLVGQPLGLG